MGIDNDNPKVTLDIVGKSNSNTSIDGLLIPRLTGDELRAKNSIYTNEQHSALVFVTESDSNPAGKTLKVTEPGYYYYYYYYYYHPESTSNGVWVRLEYDNHWKVQNTSTSATLNTDNIYQKGKVAIGFDSATPSSLYNFEVKGKTRSSNHETFTTNTNPLLTNNYYYGAILGGNTTKFADNVYSKGNMLYVADVDINEETPAGDFFNNVSVIKNEYLRSGNQEAFASGILNTKKFGDIQSYTGLTSAMNIGLNQAIITNLNQNQYGTYSNNISQLLNNESLNNHNSYTYGITMSSNNGEETTSAINLFHNNGVTFINKESDNTRKTYTFPRNNGTDGQVLTTNGATHATLSWRNISDLAQNNWKIQNTSTSATLNTDNIYQNGNVAIGFTSDNTLSNKKLEVNGDVKLQKTVNNIKYGLKTSVPFLAQNITGNVLYSSDAEDFLNGNYGNRSSILFTAQSNDSSNANLSGLISIDKTTDNKNIISGLQTINSPSGGNVTTTDVSAVVQNSNNSQFKNNGLTIKTGSDLENNEILSDEIKIYSQRRTDPNNLAYSSVKVNSDEGVEFVFDNHNNNVSSSGSYVFPKIGGQPNQVLATESNPNGDRKKLIWRDVSDLSQNNWKIQKHPIPLLQTPTIFTKKER